VEWRWERAIAMIKVAGMRIQRIADPAGDDSV